MTALPTNETPVTEVACEPASPAIANKEFQ